MALVEIGIETCLICNIKLCKDNEIPCKYCSFCTCPKCKGKHLKYCKGLKIDRLNSKIEKYFNDGCMDYTGRMTTEQQRIYDLLIRILDQSIFLKQ